MSLASVLDAIDKHNIEFVRMEISDVYGIARSRTIPARHVERTARSGLFMPMATYAFDPAGSCADEYGCGLCREVGYGDVLMFPDFTTFQVLPWCENTARILMEPVVDGKPFMVDPRLIARNQLQQLEEMGYSLLSAHEYEFYVVDTETRKPLTKDANLLSTLRTYTDTKLLHQMMRDLPKVGVDIESAEGEGGAGQLEITYRPSFGLRAGDNAHTYKLSVKEIARQHGYMASFMSKPWLDRSGCSSHFCHSLWDSTTKEPLLYDPDSPTRLSEVGQHWLAGLIEHAPALTILASPTVNCLRRIKPNTFAPINATWGVDNRTTAMRVKFNGPRGTYVENRIGASGSNPYLLLAGTVIAGMDGIRKGLSLPPENPGSAYDADTLPAGTRELPTNLEAAMEALVSDEVMREALGPGFIKCFFAMKRKELDESLQATANKDENWERNMFFEYL
ncbi:lengsin-like [Diadema antillarum]|uniref:lengsin-like n=1 Tax=Diadema antillarum TaxID=105358 RepID=UPI003A8BC52E